MSNILILDLDNTIIGNITYELLLYNLCVKTCKSAISGKHYNEETHIVRNGFTNFINNLKKTIPDIKIYVYTASQKDWALKEIKWIEKNCNIKFNRPILTREDCLYLNNNYYKSIKNISKKIKNINNCNLLIIDNNDIFLDKKENFLKCPSYNYINFIDLWENIPLKYSNNKNLNEWLLKLSNEGYIRPYLTNNYNKDIEKSIKNSEWKSKKLLNILKNNKKYINDKWWIKLDNILLNYNIDKINDIKKYINI